MRRYFHAARAIRGYAILLLFIAAGFSLAPQGQAVAQSRVVDFESVPGATIAEGLVISTQYRALYGISFRYENGKYPRIAKVGKPEVAFVGPPNGLPDGTPDGIAPGMDFDIGQYFLTDDENVDVPAVPLIIEYDRPVAAAGGMILDIDGPSFTVREQWTLTAYDQDGTTLTATVLTYGDPLTGNGLATPWTIGPLRHPTIKTIKIAYTGNKSRDDVGFAMDNFSPSTPFTYDDSQRIVFSYKQNDADRIDLWSLRPDRTGLKNLTNTTNFTEQNPAISPDGTRVVYLAEHASNVAKNGLYMIPLDGGTTAVPIVLRPQVGNRRVDCPVWMNDQWIAFAVGQDGARDLYRVEATSNSTPVKIASLSDVLGPEATDGYITDISPAGTRFVLSAGTAGTSISSFDLYLLDVDGTRPMPLYGDSPDLYADGLAKWSPNGGTIAFTHNYTSDTAASRQYLGLVAMNPTDTGTIGLDGLNELTTRAQHLLMQDWSPNGREILYFSANRYGAGDDTLLQGDLWIMSANGQNRRRITFLSGWFRTLRTVGNLACWASDGSSTRVRGDWDLYGR